jgi:formiminotetrahydrofolate cyclodeaminase
MNHEANTPHNEPSSTTPIADLTLRDFIRRTGDKEPVPGGGSVAAVTGATAAALARMVVSYSRGKKSLAEHDDLHASLDATLTRAAALFFSLADEDTAAYAEFRRLQRLPPDDPDRTASLPPTAAATATVPLAIAGAAAEVLRALEPLPGRANPWLASDLAIAADLARTAASAAHRNVAVNIPTLKEMDLDEGFLEEADKCLADARAAADRIIDACDKGW